MPFYTTFCGQLGDRRIIVFPPQLLNNTNQSRCSNIHFKITLNSPGTVPLPA